MPPDPTKNAITYLVDIRESALLAIEYLGDQSIEAYSQDTMLQDAIVRRLEVIGEASKRLDDPTRAQLPEIAWHKIRGMRNILAHQYDGIDHAIVFNAVRTDLPEAVRVIDVYLSTQPPPPSEHTP